jgi:hypothetical protein
VPLTMTDLIARVRAEIGDPSQPFRTTALGDGRTQLYDLPKQQVSAITTAEVINGASITNLTDASSAAAWSSATAYTTGVLVTYNNAFYQAVQGSTNQLPTNATYWTNVSAVVYTINDALGQMYLGAFLPNNATLIVAGNSWSLFSDTELAVYCADAVNQHTFGANITERMRDFMGHIDYRDSHKNIGNLPAIEVPLVVMLATINVFWTLANDVSSDVNVTTAEGTSIDRSAQYQQIMSQIGALTARYQDLCGQLNVGLYRMETLQLRRSSQTTGRLVPIFAPREYDDHKFPLRELPPIDRRNEDNSGIENPIWNGQGF